jgi:hypothetical protein
MGVQVILDGTGDTHHEFDVADPQDVQRAEERFRELTGRGFRAVALKQGSPGKLLREFDSNVDRSAPCLRPLRRPRARQRVSDTTDLLLFPGRFLGVRVDGES